MQNIDSEIEKAKRSIMPYFIDKYGRPLKKPYYVTQIQTLLENQHFPWIIYQAVSRLIEEGHLSRVETSTKYHEKVVLIFNRQLDTMQYNPTLKKHIRSICRLIDKYSNPTVGDALGKHLEGLVKAELRVQGFKIMGIHTARYKDKEWTKTNHDLDFIAVHTSGKLEIGVEVKNTLPIIERDELDTKLEMCEYLRVTPVFAVRWIKPYTELIRRKGGFSWVFKTQIYPPGYEKLTQTIFKKLRLPVTVRTELPEKSVKLFENWVKANT
ncbi:MAG: hypothetical protein QXX08_07445 [Candidatus Bathyarchaeia archaeon]